MEGLGGAGEKLVRCIIGGWLSVYIFSGCLGVFSVYLMIERILFYLLIWVCVSWLGVKVLVSEYLTLMEVMKVCAKIR